MTSEFTLKKIYNGYILKYYTMDTDVQKEVEVILHFTEKTSALAYISDLIE